jgi:hypothetical protein
MLKAMVDPVRRCCGARVLTGAFTVIVLRETSPEGALKAIDGSRQRR